MGDLSSHFYYYTLNPICFPVGSSTSIRSFQPIASTYFFTFNILMRQNQIKTINLDSILKLFLLQKAKKNGSIPSDQVAGQNTLLTRNGGCYRLLNIRLDAIDVNKLSNIVNSEKIKSATDNIGTFKPDSENILDSLTDLNQIDEQAHDAQTSPLNDDPKPTQQQKEDNNYKTGHFKW